MRRNNVQKRPWRGFPLASNASGVSRSIYFHVGDKIPHAPIQAAVSSQSTIAISIALTQQDTTEVSSTSHPATPIS